MTRPTIDDLRKRVGLPTEPPPQNTTEPCGTCADAAGTLEGASGTLGVFCQISRERAALYPTIRAVPMPTRAVMPCWRARGG